MFEWVGLMCFSLHWLLLWFAVCFGLILLWISICVVVFVYLFLCLLELLFTAVSCLGLIGCVYILVMTVVSGFCLQVGCCGLIVLELSWLWVVGIVFICVVSFVCWFCLQDVAVVWVAAYIGGFLCGLALSCWLDVIVLLMHLLLRLIVIVFAMLCFIIIRFIDIVIWCLLLVCCFGLV